MSSLSKPCLANLFCNALFSLFGHSLPVLLSCTLWITLLECCHIEMLSALSKTNTSGTGTKGAFHSNQNSRNFVWYIKWNRPFWFGVQPEYSGMNIIVHFDRSGHFSRLDRQNSTKFDKILSPVPLFSSLRARTITKRAMAWVGFVQRECTVPLGHS